MNRKQQGVVLASLLALALAGCSSTKTGGADDMSAGATANAAGTGSTSPASPSATSGAAATAATETPMAMPTQEPGAQSPTTMPGATPNAVVVSIETVPRAGAAGSSAVGGSGSTASTGSSTGADKQYRITLRMDDGATRVVTQDKAPAFRNGDRVNMMDGVINR